MDPLGGLEVWLITGSQHLYGPAALDEVARHAAEIAAALDASPAVPIRVVAKPVQSRPEEIRAVMLDANASDACIGVITWMHTFSPAKMWIGGLRILDKPMLHLHTQANRDLPWGEIDMDFMNLNQAAHGDREFGYIGTRMRLRRKVVVGHWTEPGVQSEIATWARAAAGWREARRLRIARFGDNMREVAVTEGDKVEAQLRLGVSVNTHGVNELVDRVASVTDAEVAALCRVYEDAYAVVPELRTGGDRHGSLRDAARIEVALRGFLEDGGFGAFTDTFEDLGALRQLPGIAVQRLMADGYGFGGEGDWKTAALVRILKVMATGLPGGTSFMEDYTYHLSGEAPRVLGAHMLEVCPSIASDRPSCEIHPLSIGGREDPVRLVFTAPPGPGFVVGLMDLGTRFRLVANEIDVVDPDAPLPRLPVARAVWEPRPDLRTSAGAWLLAGGPHHTAFTQALGMEALDDLAEMAGIELIAIGDGTTTRGIRQELRWNMAYHHLAGGL